MKINSLLAALIFTFTLASSFYSLAGIRVQMPPRMPVVLMPGETCIEKWTCSDSVISSAARKAVIEGKRPLHIASYNIHKSKGLDFRKDPDRIAEVITALDADIISLQEVFSDSLSPISGGLSRIAAKTGMYAAVAGPTMRSIHGTYGNALLSRFPIGEVRLHDISLGDFEPRGVIDADIIVGDMTIRIFVVHLGLWPMERKRQIERLLEIIPEQPSGPPVILLGDVNEWFPRSPVTRSLEARMGKPATVRSFPSLFPLLTLDRIWVSPAENLLGAKAYRSPLARIASDHLPVIAEVTVAGKSDESLIPERSR